MDGDTPRDSSEHANQESQRPDASLAHSSETDLQPPSLPDLEKLPPKPEEDPDLIAWDGLNDSENPASWSFKRKLFVSGVLVSLPLIVNVGTSILSAAGVFLDKEYNVGSEVTVLTTSLFLMVCCRPVYLSLGTIWTLLMTMQGLYIRTIDLRSAVREDRTTLPYSHWCDPVCNLLSSCSACSEPLHNHDLPLLQWRIRILLDGCNGWCLDGCMAYRRKPRNRHGRFHCNRVHWTRDWAYSWKLHHIQPSGLAMDHVDYRHLRLHIWYIRIFRPSRDLCSCSVESQGRKSTP